MSHTPEEAINAFLECSQVTNRTVFQCPKCQYQVASVLDADQVGRIICRTCDEEMRATAHRCTITFALKEVVKLSSGYSVRYGFGGLIHEPSDSSNS
jgi:hypothetical protein